MRNLDHPTFYNWRQRGPDVIAIFGSNGGPHEGAFYLPAGTSFDGYRAHCNLGVIASAGDGWDHVSVSGKNRTPNWSEMMLVHRLFFRPEEITIQYCVPKSDHINNHPHVLHLWRPWEVTIPLPPVELV